MIRFERTVRQRGYAYIFVLLVAFVLAAAIGGMYLQGRQRRSGLQRRERLLKLTATAGGAVEVFALKLKMLPYEFRDVLEAKNRFEDESGGSPEDVNRFKAFLELQEQWAGKSALVFGAGKSVLGRAAYFESVVKGEDDPANQRDMLISVSNATVKLRNLSSFMDAVYLVGVDVEVSGVGGSLTLHHEASVRLGTRDETGAGE